ncbi:hypothetical protein [Streptococcus equi]|uniref:hypothetical protein n=1 Tax=Streptococcus equi TaxID=1336 RepID=UPI001E52539C|nr:hypothetical protein [Streptococcus equi]
MEQENSRTKHVKNTIALTSTIALLGTSVGVSHQVRQTMLSQAMPIQATPAKLR